MTYLDLNIVGSFIASGSRKVEDSSKDFSTVIQNPLMFVRSPPIKLSMISGLLGCFYSLGKPVGPPSIAKREAYKDLKLIKDSRLVIVNTEGWW